MLGGAPTSRFWHPWVALVFLAIAGLDAARLAGRHAHHRGRPPLGRADASTTSATKTRICRPSTASISARNISSGRCCWRASCCCSPAPCCGSRSASRGACARRRAILLHVAAALVTIGAFIIHVYMGTAVVRGGFTSIIRGEVSPAWAKMHHRLWYDRVNRQMTGYRFAEDRRFGSETKRRE